MRTQDLLLKIYIYDTTELIILSMLYTTSLVFIYLITGILYLLTTFIQFSLLPLPSSCNQKADHTFYDFFLKYNCFKCYIKFCYTI